MVPPLPVTCALYKYLFLVDTLIIKYQLHNIVPLQEIFTARNLSPDEVFQLFSDWDEPSDTYTSFLNIVQHSIKIWQFKKVFSNGFPKLFHILKRFISDFIWT